jgi:hypothetical protein
MDPKKPPSIGEINALADWLPYVRLERELEDVLGRMFRLLTEIGTDPQTISACQNKYALMNGQLEALYSKGLGEDR